MHWLANLDLPVVDGATLTKPEEGFVTIFQSASGLCLLYPDGTITPIQNGVDVGTISLNIYSGRSTENLLKTMITEMQKLNQHLSIITEVEI